MKLKELRKQKHLTQKQICKIINCSQSSYSKLECEKLKRGVPLLVKLADFYKVSLDYILDIPTFPKRDFLSETKKEVIDKFLELNEQNQKTVVNYVKELNKNKRRL